MQKNKSSRMKTSWRHTAFYALVLFGIVAAACSRPTPHEQVQTAAETYYNHLIQGEYDKYIQGIVYCDSMTDGYRNQMIELAAQYVAREKELRGGLLSVRATRDTLQDSVALVFLEVLFGDSTREEVSMPMILKNGEWKMQ